MRKKRDRLLFLEERGLSLPEDSLYRKSSLSPFFLFLPHIFYRAVDSLTASYPLSIILAVEKIPNFLFFITHEEKNN